MILVPLIEAEASTGVGLTDFRKEKPVIDDDELLLGSDLEQEKNMAIPESNNKFLRLNREDPDLLRIKCIFSFLMRKSINLLRLRLYDMLQRL